MADKEQRKATVIVLPTFRDERGSLAVAEQLPFDIERVFWIYEPTGLDRGGHIHKSCHQVIVAASGHFDATTDGRTIRLCSPAFGLYVPPGVRLTLSGFSAGAVALVLCSEKYDRGEAIACVS